MNIHSEKVEIKLAYLFLFNCHAIFRNTRTENRLDDSPEGFEEIGKNISTMT